MMDVFNRWFSATLEALREMFPDNNFSSEPTPTQIQTLTNCETSSIASEPTDSVSTVEGRFCDNSTTNATKDDLNSIRHALSSSKTKRKKLYKKGLFSQYNSKKKIKTGNQEDIKENEIETTMETQRETQIETPPSNEHIPETSAKMRGLMKYTKNDEESKYKNWTSKIPSTQRPARRTRIPDKPDMNMNLWSIIKNFVGLELSRITIPINFNEPLSMLQRISEGFEYAELLDQAAEFDDPLERLIYIAAFIISTYSSSDARMTKPFNPLLGETYEFDRTDDLGWRLISEQVSHHPPISALYCESKSWRCLQEFGGTTKFYGNSIQITPTGKLQLEFLKSGDKYTWDRTTTAIKNIVVGRQFIDHYGDVFIEREAREFGGKCHLKYFPHNSIANKNNFRKVEGEIIDQNNMIKWLIMGNWDQQVDVVQVPEVVPWKGKQSRKISNTCNKRTIWSRRMPEPGSEKYYNFSIFASQLNEMEPCVAPTDSRFRPDQRLLELGLWKEAREEKARLENMQRLDKSENYVHVPAWFKIKEENNEVVYEYGGEYWECKQKQDWSRCPHIF